MGATTLTLRFTGGGSLAARAVQTWTWSWCSHVDAEMDDGTLIGAVPEHGVWRRPASLDGIDGKAAARVERYAVTVNETQRAAIVTALTAQIGRPYDWRAIAGFALHRDWRDPARWFCSELVAWAFEAAGRPLLRADHLDRVSPRDLLLSPHLVAVAAA